ncbi:MAG: hypothetical protein DRR06_13715 [Gammaproteobacteria bacterium]|nr:MAG: hypothetical protein DRR06_13715 [Gammaproteobacteria bacterium]
MFIGSTYARPTFQAGLLVATFSDYRYQIICSELSIHNNLFANIDGRLFRSGYPLVSDCEF